MHSDAIPSLQSRKATRILPPEIKFPWWGRISAGAQSQLGFIEYSRRTSYVLQQSRSPTNRTKAMNSNNAGRQLPSFHSLDLRPPPPQEPAPRMTSQPHQNGPDKTGYIPPIQQQSFQPLLGALQELENRTQERLQRALADVEAEKKAPPRNPRSM
jgi:hypothetical protein